MKRSKYRRISDQIPLLILWMFFSLFLWSWIFSLTSDTTPDKKLVIAVDARVTDTRGMAAELEKYLNGEMRMVRVYAFDSQLMSGESLRAADILILRRDGPEEYRELIVPEKNDFPVLYDASDGGRENAGPWGRYILFGESEYLLCPGRNSAHLQDGETERFIGILLNGGI